MRAFGKTNVIGRKDMYPYYIIGDIDHDMSVLSMEKILYENGFSVTESEIDSDSEYETFWDALLSMDGYIDEDDGENTDSMVFVYKNSCLRKYVRLACKYGRINGLSKGNNFWLERLDWYINEEMSSIGDYSYDYDYNITSERKAFFKVYIGPEFFQTVNLIQAVSSILHYAEESCKALEKITSKAKIIPIRTTKERKKAA